MKKIKIELNVNFEKEAMKNKKIYELDLANENIAFDLFSKQMNFTKLKRN